MEPATGSIEGSTTSGSQSTLDEAGIERLIEERIAARKARNFQEADRIRDLLSASSVLLEDMPGGKTLRRRG